MRSEAEPDRRGYATHDVGHQTRAIRSPGIAVARPLARRASKFDAQRPRHRGRRHTGEFNVQDLTLVVGEFNVQDLTPVVHVWLASASASQAEPPVCIDACALARAKVAGLVAKFDANQAVYKSRRFSKSDTRALLLRKDKKMNTTEAQRHRE